MIHLVNAPGALAAVVRTPRLHRRALFAKTICKIIVTTAVFISNTHACVYRINRDDVSRIHPHCQRVLRKQLQQEEDADVCVDCGAQRSGSWACGGERQQHAEVHAGDKRDEHVREAHERRADQLRRPRTLLVLLHY